MRLQYCIALAAFVAMGAARAERPPPKTWGLALGLRSADIPYDAETNRVNDLIPLLYYERGRLFVRGLTVGYSVWDGGDIRLNAIGRYRFFDIPADLQQRIRGNAFDTGAQMRHWFGPRFSTDLELLSDGHGRTHANLKATYRWQSGDWELRPSAGLRWKNASFNNHYYGLDVAQPGSAFDVSLGAEARYHVSRNLYLIGQAKITALDDRTADTAVIRRQFPSEVMLGFGFFADRRAEPAPRLKAKPYVRLAYGWASESDLPTLLSGTFVRDPENNQLTSVFYGIPVSDTLMGLPLAVYFTPGIVYHHRSDVQEPFPELVAAFKVYYTFQWPVRVRLGAAEGLSYTTQVLYVEAVTRESKGEYPSKLLNYLDLSADVNVGDLTGATSLKDLWFGIGIHHRSGIYQTSSAFGRIRGGSNYPQIYLQYHW
ncbi:MAG TPA: MipA/OmpV family protein [Gammaproteobacteria bacterium]|nr:MipA/OmpV family protein [Gammaproteobacteria bacterium]